MSDFHSLLKERTYFYEQILLIKTGTISFNTLFPTRNNFFYSSIIKYSRPGGSKFTECRFGILWISKAFLLKEVIETFEKVKNL